MLLMGGNKIDKEQVDSVHFVLAYTVMCVFQPLLS